MKQVISKRNVFIFLFVLCINSRCAYKSLEIAPERMELSTAEKEQIQISARRFNFLMSSLIVQGQAKEDFKQKLSIKNFITEYLYSITDPNEKQFTLELLENNKMKNLMAWLDPSTDPSMRGQEIHSPYDDLSTPVKEIADEMQRRINMATDEYITNIQVFSNQELSIALKMEIQKIETEIQASKTLQEDEKRLLLITTAMQFQAMDTMVTAAKSIFDTLQLSTGGRTTINWNKFKNIVGSILVTAVAVALVVAVVVSVGVALGAISAGAWIAASITTGAIVTNGMMVGAGLGIVVGGIAAYNNKCVTNIGKASSTCD